MVVDRIGLGGGLERDTQSPTRSRSLVISQSEAVFHHRHSRTEIRSLKLFQIDLANRVMTEHHIKESIGRGRFKPDG